MIRFDLRSVLAVAIVVAVFYYTYFIFLNIRNPIPPPGDSVDYHVPIAESILNGTFLHPNTFRMPQWYYPASSEAINSIFLFFHIPLLSNIFATLVLCFVTYKLARTFKVNRDFSLLFSLTFITLNIMLRWLNQVSVDVWVAVFFCITLILLEKPRSNKSYFAKLGFSIGMLIGSKYTAISLLIPLVALYTKSLVKKLHFLSFIILLCAITFFGLFWYIRNYIATGNPFYPLPILGFPGKEIFGGMRVWNVGVDHPFQMINAAFGEFKLWLFSIPLAILFLAKKSVFGIADSMQGSEEIRMITRLFIIGIVLFIIYLFYPTSQEEWIMVSSFRYSYAAFIVLILGVFKLLLLLKKEFILIIIVLSSMLGIFGMEYHPKLIFIQIPLSLFCIFLINKYLLADRRSK